MNLSDNMKKFRCNWKWNGWQKGRKQNVNGLERRRLKEVLTCLVIYHWQRKKKNEATLISQWLRGRLIRQKKTRIVFKNDPTSNSEMWLVPDFIWNLTWQNCLINCPSATKVFSFVDEQIKHFLIITTEIYPIFV